MVGSRSVRRGAADARSRTKMTRTDDDGWYGGRGARGTAVIVARRRPLPIADDRPTRRSEIGRRRINPEVSKLRV